MNMQDIPDLAFPVAGIELTNAAIPVGKTQQTA